MKLSKEQLRKIIKEELQTAIEENREEQLKTIPAKIIRLNKAIENAKRGIKNMEADAVDDMDLQDIRSDNAYQAKTEEILNLEDKIERLEAELEKLKGQTIEESEHERDIKPIGITSDSRAFSALQWWREVADRPTLPYRFKEDGPPDTLIRLHPNSNMFKKQLNDLYEAFHNLSKRMEEVSAD